jgi:hypothetical protein
MVLAGLNLAVHARGAMCDAGTVKSHLLGNYFESAQDVAADIRLTFQNAMQYNVCDAAAAAAAAAAATLRAHAKDGIPSHSLYTLYSLSLSLSHPLTTTSHRPLPSPFVCVCCPPLTDERVCAP